MRDKGKRFNGVELDFEGLKANRVRKARLLSKWEAYQAGRWDATFGEGFRPVRHFKDDAAIELFEKEIAALLARGEVVIVPPGTIRKAKNFSKAVARDVLDGRRRVPADVRASRLELCRTCELYNQAKGTCLHPDCGCVMTRKTRWNSAECPVGRWGQYQLNTGRDEG